MIHNLTHKLGDNPDQDDYSTSLLNKQDMSQYNPLSEEEKSTHDSISLRSLSSTNSADGGKNIRNPRMKPKKSLKLSTLMEEVSDMGSDFQSCNGTDGFSK